MSDSISLADLHGQVLTWEGPDGTVHRTEPFKCSEEGCEICRPNDGESDE